MKYKVGDKVSIRFQVFMIDAEILEVYENGEYEEFCYYVRFQSPEGNVENILIKEEDIVCYQIGTMGYLKGHLDWLLETYSKEDILNILK